MTALTVTEISTTDIPMGLSSGTGKKRQLVFIRGTSDGTNTLDLTTYVPGVADVEGLFYQTTDNAQFSSTATWSTTTLTVVDSGAVEIGLVVNLT